MFRALKPAVCCIVRREEIEQRNPDCNGNNRVERHGVRSESAIL